MDNEHTPKISSAEIVEMKGILHDLSGLFTELISSGETLNRLLANDSRQRHSGDICEGAERGLAMVRRARAVLTSADRIPEIHPAIVRSGNADVPGATVV